MVGLQALVSLGLLAALFGAKGFGESVAEVARSADLRWLALGLAVAGVVQFLCLLRWRIFLGIAGVEIRFPEAAAAFFAGLFSNLFLPGGAGGDVVKIGLLAAGRHPVGRSAMSVLMDRLCGTVSMILLGSTLMAWQFDWLSQSPLVTGLIHSIAIYLGVLAFLILLSIFLTSAHMVERLPARWPGRKLLVGMAGVYFQCALQWRRTLSAVFLSIGMLALFFLSYYCSARAFGVEIPVGQFLALMPTVDIISGLPVSLGGFGVREGVFTFLLGHLAGVSGALAVSVSLGGYLLNALWGLPGALFWLWHRKENTK